MKEINPEQLKRDIFTKANFYYLLKHKIEHESAMD